MTLSRDVSSIPLILFTEKTEIKYWFSTWAISMSLLIYSLFSRSGSVFKAMTCYFRMLNISFFRFLFNWSFYIHFKVLLVSSDEPFCFTPRIFIFYLVFMLWQFIFKVNIYFIDRLVLIRLLPYLGLLSLPECLLQAGMGDLINSLVHYVGELLRISFSLDIKLCCCENRPKFS